MLGVVIAGAALLLSQAEEPAVGAAIPSTTTSPTRVEVPENDVYASLVRNLLQGWGGPWKGTVYVSTRICTDGSLHDFEPMCSGSLTEEDRLALVARLPDLDLHFTKNPDKIITIELMEQQMKLGGGYRIRPAVIQLGPIVEAADELHVEASFSCGYTCGFGTTWVLRHRSEGWTVTGSVGDYWQS